MCQPLIVGRIWIKLWALLNGRSIFMNIFFWHNKDVQHFCGKVKVDQFGQWSEEETNRWWLTICGHLRVLKTKWNLEPLWFLTNRHATELTKSPTDTIFSGPPNRIITRRTCRSILPLHMHQLRWQPHYATIPGTPRHKLEHACLDSFGHILLKLSRIFVGWSH